ncbi:MAG: hypothetical protein WC659_06610 [Patescibacteria group bacterium]
MTTEGDFQKTKASDLEERLEQYGEKIIDLAKKTPKNVVTIPILSQLIRSGTSMGANYTCPVR